MTLHEQHQGSKRQGCHACWRHLHKFSEVLSDIPVLTLQKLPQEHAATEMKTVYNLKDC